MTTTYAILSTALFALMGFMLSGEHVITRALRFTCICMTVFGLVITLNQAGFLIEAPAGMRWF